MEGSALGRLASVLFSPQKTFEAIRERPTWLFALVALIIVGVVASTLVIPKVDFEKVTRESLEQRGDDLSEEEVQRIVDIQERAAPIMGIVFPLVAQPIILLLVAVILMVVFKLLGGELTFVQSFSTYLHSLMPRLVAGLLSIPVILGREEFTNQEVQSGSFLASNLGILAPEDAGPALRAILTSVDIFSLWTLALLIIGFATVAKVSRSTATFTVIAIWILYVLGKAGFAGAFT